MQKRYGLYMADWYDQDRVRHRKGFKTKRSAAAYQRRMREAVAASKKAPASRAPKNSPRHGANRKNRTAPAQ